MSKHVLYASLVAGASAFVVPLALASHSGQASASLRTEVDACLDAYESASVSVGVSGHGVSAEARARARLRQCLIRSVQRMGLHVQTGTGTSTSTSSSSTSSSGSSVSSSSSVSSGTGAATSTSSSSPSASAGGSTSTSTGMSAGKVVINDFRFSSRVLVVKKGTTVTWTNEDRASHTITGNARRSPLQSPVLATGESFSFTFNQTGTFSYHCDLHPHMRAIVRVVD